jgi:hypothetical protein
VRERQIGGFEGERFVDRGDGGAAQCRDRFDRPLLAQVPSDDLYTS